MRFTELLRDVADNMDEHGGDTLSNLLRTAADTIDNQNVYKLKWAELAERCARLEKANETLLAELKTYRKTEDDR